MSMARGYAALGPLLAPVLAPLLALVLALLLTGPAGAQDTPAAPPAPTLASLRAELDNLPKAVDSSDDVLPALAHLKAIADQTDSFIAGRNQQLAEVNTRLAELGEARTGTAQREDGDVTRQRSALQKTYSVLDADIRLARLLAVETQQRSAAVRQQRRALFEAQLTGRSASPLGSEFWQDLREAYPANRDRMAALAAEFRAGLATATAPDHRGTVLRSLLLAVLMVFPGIWLAEYVLVRVVQRLVPSGRLRRSSRVLALVLATVLLVGLGCHRLYATLDQLGVLGPQARQLALALVRCCVFAAFVVGLGRALLSNARPSWRLPAITDAAAGRLGGLPWLVALVGVLVWIPTQVNAVADVNFAAVLATHVFTALVLTGLIAIVMRRLRPLKADVGPAATAEPLLLAGLLRFAIGLLIIAIWALVGTGYVALASFLAAQLTWASIVATAFYVLFRFADDLVAAVLASDGRFGQQLQSSFGLAPQTLNQLAVLLGGLCRVALFFYMLVAIVMPLGTGPQEVFSSGGRFSDGLKIGAFHLTPAAFLNATGVLAGGLLVLSLLKRWLEHSYLPATQLEPGMRSSIATLLGYAGNTVVLALALSALGMGIERIAWIASALSVGIGFGLQAIVQNFISGLILLAERPIKVGDWVTLGEAEGDVRRINVRATEIQLSDRSTLIVPNSEFITKAVRNMTLANAGGRVQLKLPLPLSANAEQVRAHLLDAFATHPDMLPDPAPQVQLTGIDGGQLHFQATGYVHNPRTVGRVRSDLLFAILARLQGDGVPLTEPAAPAPVPGAPASTALSASAPSAPVPSPPPAP